MRRCAKVVESRVIGPQSIQRTCTREAIEGSQFCERHAVTGPARESQDPRVKALVDIVYTHRWVLPRPALLAIEELYGMVSRP